MAIKRRRQRPRAGRRVKGRGRYGTGSVYGSGKFSLYRKGTQRMLKRNVRRTLNNPLATRALGMGLSALGMGPAATGAALAASRAVAQHGRKGSGAAATNSVLNALVGQGRYKRVKRKRSTPRAPFHNESTVMATGSKFSAPRFQTGHAAGVDAGGLVISHQEFIGHIYGNSVGKTFETFDYAVNPGLAATFPMLSQFAQNFDKYEMVQCVFHFETALDAGTIQSTNGQVGEISTYGHVNIKMPKFETVSQFQANGGRSAPTTSGQACGIECANSQLKGLPNAGINYIRNHPVEDAVEYDQGLFQIAVSSTPPALVDQVLGKLYVSYTVKLIKPRLQSYFSRNVRQDTFLANRSMCKLGYQPKDKTESYEDKLNLTMIALGKPNKCFASFPEEPTENNKSVFAKTSKSNLGCSLTVMCPAQLVMNKLPLPVEQGGQFERHLDKTKTFSQPLLKKQSGVLRLRFPDDVKGLVKVDINSYCTPVYSYPDDKPVTENYKSLDSDTGPATDYKFPGSGQYLNETRFIDRIKTSKSIIPVIYNMKLADVPGGAGDDNKVKLAGFNTKTPDETNAQYTQLDEIETYPYINTGVDIDGNTLNTYQVPGSIDNFVTPNGLSTGTEIPIDLIANPDSVPVGTISPPIPDGASFPVLEDETLANGTEGYGKDLYLHTRAKGDQAHSSGWSGNSSIYLRVQEPQPGEQNFVDICFTHVTAPAGINKYHKFVTRDIYYTIPTVSSDIDTSGKIDNIASGRKFETKCHLYTSYGENGPSMFENRLGEREKTSMKLDKEIIILPLQTRLTVTQVDDFNKTGTSSVHTWETLHRQSGDEGKIESKMRSNTAYWGDSNKVVHEDDRLYIKGHDVMVTQDVDGITNTSVQVDVDTHLARLFRPDKSLQEDFKIPYTGSFIVDEERKDTS
jgi:hypothetical protein